MDPVSFLIPFFEMSTKDFQFSRVISYPYQFGSDHTRLHETCLGSDPNGITLESDPVWVRIANPNGLGSVESRVNARPIRYSLGSLVPISCKRGQHPPVTTPLKHCPAKVEGRPAKKACLPAKFEIKSFPRHISAVSPLKFLISRQKLYKFHQGYI